ncbi:MAG: hypothetical protein K2Q09_00960 [Phycisphaerales bacterium]|nr:hypothetical protein [Phycisphaerales bacterium]
MWLASIAVTDRWQLAQFIYWFNPALPVAAVLLAVAGWALRPGAWRRPSSAVLAAAGLACCLMLAREFGLIRVLTHLGAPTPPASAIRVVHWNLSVFDVPKRLDIGDALSVQGLPDIVLISMQNNRALWDQLARGVQGATRDQVHFINAGDEKVFSRYPVTTTETFRIPFRGKGDQPPVPPTLVRRCFSGLFRLLHLHNRSTTTIEDATIVGLTFDTGAQLGRPLRVWFIDMPSNPLASKAELVARVTAHAAGLRAAGKLPEPDLIVGDFNIPLGSESLRAYAPGYTPASDAAGLGRLASWPRTSPALQLDHMLVRPGWRAGSYTLTDPGASEHMAQTALLWPADAPKK